MARYHQGMFRAKNPQKYKGDPSNIVYRSSWELKLYMQFDSRPDVLEWSSEEVIVPYISPKDNKKHRYFPDAVIKIRDRNGVIKTIMVEIKPFKQTLPPVKGKRMSKGFINEVLTYAVNDAKWKYAREFCKTRGWDFQIITENELGL